MRHGNATRQQQILLQVGDGPRAGINWTHELALRAWNGHMRLDVSSGGAVSASNSLAISQTEAATERDYSTFLFARTLLETRGSFRDFESWTAAASSGDSGIQVRSRRIAAEHTATLAKYEQLATQRFLRDGSVFRLQADGLKRVYQVEIGTLLWKFPWSLRVYAENVSSFRWIEELGPRGPWLVDRVIGARGQSGEIPYHVRRLPQEIRGRAGRGRSSMGQEFRMGAPEVSKQSSTLCSRMSPLETHLGFSRIRGCFIFPRTPCLGDDVFDGARWRILLAFAFGRFAC